MAITGDRTATFGSQHTFTCTVQDVQGPLEYHGWLEEKNAADLLSTDSSFRRQESEMLIVTTCATCLGGVKLWYSCQPQQTSQFKVS